MKQHISVYNVGEKRQKVEYGCLRSIYIKCEVVGDVRRKQPEYLLKICDSYIYLIPSPMTSNQTPFPKLHNFNEMYTPPEAVQYILPFLPKGKVYREACYGE